MSEELKPCPFCGGEAKIGDASVYCNDCPAIVWAWPYEDIESAITTWNHRAQQPSEPLTVDELRQMIGQWVWVESKDVLCSNGWYRVEPQFRKTISLAGADGTIYETSITSGDSAAYHRPPEEGEKE